KAKIKWAIEGDENTSFFHGTLKKKQRQLAIKELQFSLEEIKRAVWDFGGDRAPRPDGFSFKFIMTFWDLLKEDVDYLESIMEKLGFGLKWRTWIFGCLQNARTSVLVNGSPTSKFDIRRGLQQGDPLSPFLFILAMEGLHMLTCKAEESGIFKGALFGHDNMNISLLIYVDDVIFVGECNLLCVCVPDETISDMACSIGCGAASFPMKYLGIPVGCNMARCSSWNAIIQRFSSKLPLWKARLLSVGGRLSLIKSVLGHLPSYYMSIYSMHSSTIKKLESMRNRFFLGGGLEERKMTWVRWNKCLASKDHGGLGIRSILGLNIGLLFKWIWRFLCSASDLWVRVIKCIYGSQGGINVTPKHYSSLSTWSGILCSIHRFKQKGIDLISYCSRKVGDGSSTKFWEDVCMVRLPLGGAKMVQFTELQAKVENIVLSDQDMSPIGTRWTRSIPIKVNIFIWRLTLNKLPLRVNLDRRGSDVGSILYPICQLDSETINHIFFSCDMALDLWAKLARWWNLNFPMCANILEWFEWIGSLHMSNRVKSSLEGVGGSLMWYIWNYRFQILVDLL
ncbi:RNA-directed DNA polymerase, eukaryota, reverse transcriptase zinc-binding domain protein, partial [Tanacetum coccineum]